MGSNPTLSAMKRYMLFTCQTYYPRGGMNDFVESFDSLQAAQEASKPDAYVWSEVYDLQEERIIAHQYNDDPWASGPMLD